MKDWTDESHSPILMQAIPSSRKTSNLTSDARDDARRRRRITFNHSNHLINHLIHLNDHFNHLNHQTKPQDLELQDLSQHWQNDTEFCKHCGKLEANPDARAEVLHSSSVLLTSIQVQLVSIQVFLTSHQVSCQPNPCETCTSVEVSQRLQLLFFHQIAGKNSIQFGLV